MNASSFVRLFQGRSFSSSELRFLKSSFKQSYEDSILRNSEKKFVKCYEGSLITQKTFSQFNLDVHSALHLITENVGSEQSVFVALVTNSYLSLVFMTAAFLKGLTVCPINPLEGPERISAKIQQIQEPVTIWTNKDISDYSWSFTVYSMELSTDSPKINTESYFDFPSDRPMVLIFTSGSTGYSKIVEQMETNILSNVDALIEHHQLHEGKTIGTSLPIFHVNALEFSFFASLLSGSQLVLYDQFDIFTVAQSLEEDRIQILSVVPTLLQLILKRKKDFLSMDLSHFKYFVSAASALPKSVSQEILSHFQRPIIQGYGLSEAVNFSATLPIDMKFDEYHHWSTHFAHPSIGVALRGNEILIRNSEGQECEEGETGEICVRGFNVMRSYRGMDAEKMFQDGFLKTGDLGYFRRSPSGIKFFFVSGRVKDVIKRYGETVSLREVDDLLAPILGAGIDIISVGFENDFSGEEIGLIVQGDSTAEIKSSLLKFLSQAYNDLMRPRVILFTRDAIRTPSGKPQRWKFKECFTPYKAKIFSSEPIFGSLE